MFCHCFSVSLYSYALFFFFLSSTRNGLVDKEKSTILFFSVCFTHDIIFKNHIFKCLLSSVVCCSNMQQVFFLFQSFSGFLLQWQQYRWFSPHCHSAVSRVWRSILWRRAWEKQANQRREMRRKEWLTGLEVGGMLEVVGGYKRKYACSIRNQEMKAPCCYGNTPAVVEYQCCFNDIGTIGF